MPFRHKNLRFLYNLHTFDAKFCRYDKKPLKMGPKTALSVGSRGAGLQQKSKLLCFFLYCLMIV